LIVEIVDFFILFQTQTMTPFVAEVLGTALLITLGNGVVANVLLNKTNGNNSGWIVITLGWCMAVFVGVFASATASGAHLNPAVTIALAVAGKFEWGNVPSYILAQFIGAFIGSILVWLTYYKHFAATPDQAIKRSVFCTGPAIRSGGANFMTELLASFVFILAVLQLTGSDTKLGSIDALPVALIVLGIGLCLGGPTGYAINPARDLGPRLMHTILPIQGKGDSDWAYAWVPGFAPVVGGVLAALVNGQL
jgi:glycerol uptake facilitator protein